MRRQRKRPVVQLTSLLDLLFVMIFVSLLQTKAPKAQDRPEPKPKPAPVAEKKPRPEPTKPKPKPRIANISATFHFYPTSQSAYKFSGKYRMNGVFDRENQTVQLGGVGWIDKPTGVEVGMVPLNGQINTDGSFTGRVDDPSCQSFTLKKTVTAQGVEIAGSYEGTYICAQGETGLTLTIQ